jgi:aryl-alcohol dehydrogenase-like predicted oxidoreductase
VEYRNLGNTGLQVSSLGFGGNVFGWTVGEQDVKPIIDRVIDAGISFIDTADIYGSTRSEEFLGKALKGRRHDVILATKFGIRITGNPTTGVAAVLGNVRKGEVPKPADGSRHYIVQAVEASLKRLQTDYIDLYQMHRPDPFTPIEETLRALDDLVKSGKVRYIGCSNFAAWQLSEALWTSKTCSLHSFATIQSQYNLLTRSIEAEIVPCCRMHNVGIIPWAPLAGGFLTGKYKPGTSASSSGRLSTPKARGLYGDIFSDNSWNILAKLEEFAKERGHTIAELAIAWLLAKPYVSSVIASATKVEQIAANIDAAEWKLNVDDAAQIDAIISHPG